jgi:hypothetical protein
MSMLLRNRPGTLGRFFRAKANAKLAATQTISSIFDVSPPLLNAPTLYQRA